VLATQVGTYDQLVAAIRQAHAASEARVEQAAQQEKVREAWEIGKLIDEHVLQHKERADYGKQVILRLSGDLPISDTQLYSMLQFARDYPISPPARKLSWSHYEELLSLNDVKEEDAVAAMAEKENWTRDQVRDEVKKRKAAKSGTPVAPVKEAPLALKPGKPGTYKMVKAAAGPETGRQVIDLGFSNYYRTSRDLRFKEGAILEVLPAFPEGASAPSDMIKLSKRTAADLYTYRAWVTRVLDGDTIEVVVDLGFGVRSVQVLRLRGLDCPELVSKEGKEAKAFVESALDGKKMILIKTVKSDKYDRYLADIFIPQKGGNYLNLNNELLAKGYAVRVHD
jgi:endonuclease YncB( thermonuclease family)